MSLHSPVAVVNRQHPFDDFGRLDLDLVGQGLIEDRDADKSGAPFAFPPRDIGDDPQDTLGVVDRQAQQRSCG